MSSSVLTCLRVVSSCAGPFVHRRQHLDVGVFGAQRGKGLVQRLERGGARLGRGPAERQLETLGERKAAGRVALDAEADVHGAGDDVLVLGGRRPERAARVNGDVDAPATALFDLPGPWLHDLRVVLVIGRREVAEHQLDTARCRGWPWCRQTRSAGCEHTSRGSRADDLQKIASCLHGGQTATVCGNGHPWRYGSPLATLTRGPRTYRLDRCGSRD